MSAAVGPDVLQYKWMAHILILISKQCYYEMTHPSSWNHHHNMKICPVCKVGQRKAFLMLFKRKKKRRKKMLLETVGTYWCRQDMEMDQLSVQQSSMMAYSWNLGSAERWNKTQSHKIMQTICLERININPEILAGSEFNFVIFFSFFFFFFFF